MVEGTNIELAVEPLSQLDPSWGVSAQEARQICSMVATKMILTYLLPNSDAAKLTPTQIKDKMAQFGGRNEAGYWKHSAQVEVLKHAGLVAWRRNWHSSKNNLEHFVSEEGYSEAQMQALRTQVAKEIDEDEQANIARSLVASLAEGNPVIVSVGAGFDTNRDSHQIVLCGYRKNGDKEEFIYNDPDTDPAKLAKLHVSVDYFYTYFRFTAIFAQKPASA